MINNNCKLTLENYEADDINDIIEKLAKSFQIEFKADAFKCVDNFGNLCDVFEANLSDATADDCTTQQAFYKIRETLSTTQSIDKDQIILNSKLADFFPIHDRKKQVRKFQNQLGIKLKILTYPDFLALIFGVGLIASVIAFFFDWKIAVSGFAFFILAHKIANFFGKQLTFETVKQLTQKAVSNYYVDMRRSKLTTNKGEVLAIITDTFHNSLGIEKEQLTRDAVFSWAKTNDKNSVNIS